MTDRADRLLIEARMYIAAAVKEAGGCDHSVGICACADVRLLNSIDHHLIQKFKTGDLIQAFADASPVTGHFNNDGTPIQSDAFVWRKAAADAIAEYAQQQAAPMEDE